MKTRIKFCGLVEAADVRYAVALGVDAIGLVFYGRSPRFVDESVARELRRQIPSYVRVVGLFVNEAPAVVARLKASVGLDVLQFHGDETAADCEAASHGTPYWKAVRMRSSSDLLESKAQFASAEALLLDTYSTGYGGSGQTFDWSWIEPAGTARYVMSGGLNAANVADAISHVRPVYVDVSSGIQGDDPRRKDARKMLEFVARVCEADHQSALRTLES